VTPQKVSLSTEHFALSSSSAVFYHACFGDLAPLVDREVLANDT
jgi:hypothetical protein